MRTGAEADIRRAVPVTAVMLRLIAQQRKIADLVMHESRLFEPPAEVVIHRVLRLFIYRLYLAFLQPFRHRSPVFVHQAVRRYMLYFQAERRLDIFLPLRHRLRRQGVHQVDGEVLKTRLLCHTNRIYRLRGIMPSSDESQQLVLKRLNTDGQSVDAGFPDSH